MSKNGTQHRFRKANKFIFYLSSRRPSTPHQNPTSPPDFPEMGYKTADNQYSPKNADSSGIYGRWLLIGFY